ncbi:hypothetical protein CPB84DRAFT_1850993 [Gymnopilus junonius]|uniref:Uncharacterized protein n=1 Tax=Gymnopilus junonius TaxID=109634 RepID=A0A9P5NGE5_GYMJU|nr:hypothetical protein CPB84DRAFT_1850993 [Gymnopilus junonius]
MSPNSTEDGKTINTTSSKTSVDPAFLAEILANNPPLDAAALDALLGNRRSHRATSTTDGANPDNAASIMDGLADSIHQLSMDGLADSIHRLSIPDSIHRRSIAGSSQNLQPRPFASAALNVQNLTSTSQQKNSTLSLLGSVLVSSFHGPT